MLSSDWWQAVSPYLDHVLGLREEDRGAWLVSFGEQNPALAAHLETLLDEHRALSKEGFLERLVVPLPGQTAHPGERIGAYTLVSPIGQGGMGTVWLADRTDGRFTRRAAVKFLSLALAAGDSAQQFKREGRILGRLMHPHIAELLDAGVSENGQPYLVLEYVDGEPLDSYCDRRILDTEARVRLFLDVLAAVAHAHLNLVVHRDIKPSNVLVRTDGQVKLLDFGIAKLLEDEASAGAVTLLTRPGGGALTPEYAAPEQLKGAPLTTATDVYALGVLLYVLLSGQHPAGPGPLSPADVIRATVDSEPARVSDVVASSQTGATNPDTRAAKRASTPDKLQRALRGDLDTIAAKALKKNPQERYLSVTAFADDLRRYLKQEPISARPDTLRYRAAKFVRRNRSMVALAALALAAAVAGIISTLIQAGNARSQRDFALRQLTRAEAINDLNSFVLSDAAPSGKPFTVNELLERAEHIVRRQRGESDASRVELLISIGRQYWGQDEDASAGRVLDEAYKLSRGLPERSTRARASCALATVLARGRDLPHAEILIQEGLRELSSQPQFVLDRVFCLQRGSEVAREQGAQQVAIARAQQAQGLLKESSFDSDLLDMGALMHLAESYRAAGRLSEASATFQQASVLLAALGRDDTQTAGTLFNNWALAVHFLGRPLEAETLFRRAIAISSSNGAEQSVSPILLVNYARVLRDLGRLREAADYAERGYSKAQQAGDQTVVNQSLFMRAAVYRTAGDLTRAAGMLSELEPRLRRSLPAGHQAFASLAFEQALLAQGRADLRSALALANQAMAITDASIKAGQPGREYLPTLLVLRSGIELEMRHPDIAATDASRALGTLQETAQPRTFSGRLGRAWLALGRALQAQGKTEQARAALQSATEHLEHTLGTDHAETLAARRLATESPIPNR